MKAMLWLVLGTAVFWAASSYTASRLWPDAPTFEWNTAAALLCLLPGAATLAWAAGTGNNQPQQQLLAVLGGTMVRMAVAIVGGLILFLSVKGFEYQRFWLFVVVYYLFTLALEMVLIVRSMSAKQAPSKN